MVLSNIRDKKRKKHLLKDAQTQKEIVFEDVTYHSLQSYQNSLKFVDFVIDGKSYKIDVNKELNVMSKEDFENKDDSAVAKCEDSPLDDFSFTVASSTRSKGGKNKSKGRPKSRKIEEKIEEHSDEIEKKPLPESVFKVIEYSLPETFEMPQNYIRFIEPTPEQLDEEVEYDMDEEDCAWLKLMNEHRLLEGLPNVSMEDFEILMDRLEKESFFQMNVNGKDLSLPIDEEAVCCICMDGDCQNTNVILFCDMCNLAVHQECYGVPYIPEGQWLCRRCLQSPSCPVDCLLCPSKGGAFKQTADGRWAHVVCALWIPEVIFANTVFLEPVDNLQNIPQARWKLACYICKLKSTGACIQCSKTNCYTAFHVTCAQQSGLYMKMEAIRQVNSSGVTVNVKKICYCDIHSPHESDTKASTEDEDSIDSMKCSSKVSFHSKSKWKKLLAEKRCAAPVVSIPTLPMDKLREIADTISDIPKKNQFIQRLIAYWSLKRQSRNGVPLLRRLQATHISRRDTDKETVKKTSALLDQLQYWQRLRQDLEKARLLCELIRKREKLKRELIQIKVQEVELKLFPIYYILKQIVILLMEKDTSHVFWEPVNRQEFADNGAEVPDYYDVIKKPIDLSTMLNQITTHQNTDIDNLYQDFNLMIKNCLEYNSKDTVFYKIGLKMKEFGKTIFDLAKAELKSHQNMFTTVVSSQQLKEDLKTSKDKNLKQVDSNTIPKKHYNENSKTKQSEEKAKTEILSSKSDSASENYMGLRKRTLLKETGTMLNTRKRTSSSVDYTSSPVCSGVNRRTANVHRIAKIEPETRRVTTRPKRQSDNLQKSEVKLLAKKSKKNTEGCNDELQGESFKMYREKGDDDPDSDSSSGHSLPSSEETDKVQHIMEGDQKNIIIEPLDLVWAKARGVPWYPALVIDPKMPRTGYFHNGVAITVPPDDVLIMAQSYDQPVYLVLFFDAKRSWHWLPREKLEPLGLDYTNDKTKLLHSRKKLDRKAVRKAYRKALLHRCKVTGEDIGSSMESNTEDN